MPAACPPGAERGPAKKLKARLTTALFTGSGQAPVEYTELQLCRDVYHCRPSELAEEDAAVVRVHLALLTAESRVRRFESGGKGGRIGGPGGPGGRGQAERRKRGKQSAV